MEKHQRSNILHLDERTAKRIGMKWKVFFSVLFCVALWQGLAAQRSHFAGFGKALGGQAFAYHSPFSYNEKSLLVRARADSEPISWVTEVVPASYAEKSATFIWAYGIGAKQPSQSFDLYVEGQKVLTFTTPDGKEVTRAFTGENGVALTFNRSMIDLNKDEMGTATLLLPASYFTPGKAVRLKVDGVDNESYEWFMVFQRALQEEVKAFQLNTVTKQDGLHFHTVRLEFIHLGGPSEVRVAAKGVKAQHFAVNTGFNEVDFLVPVAEKAGELAMDITIGETQSPLKVEVGPVKKWVVDLVQHSHTDIGYTRSQTEILAEHLRFIDYALDYCDQTDDYPDDAKFRWTCEAAWTVREYLKSRPQEQIDRLLARIKEGRIEVTGMFFNFSEIIDETALAIQLQTLKAFKAKGIDVTAAMQNDVNGIGWAMIDLFEGTGVKYLTMGQHGHRARIPFDKPTSFWWESEAGNRLLAYRSEHYMHGNALSLTSGAIDQFRANLSGYLKKLEEKGYPYDRTAFQFSGYLTDNSPPSTMACDIVKEWNDKYEWPKLRLSLASAFMVYLEENESGTLPVKKTAWPDWWTDGFGSAFNETKAARRAHADMIANTGLLSMARLMGTPMPKDMDRDMLRAFDELFFYDEHTFGAAESITDPLSENSIVQWGQKSAYAWTAFKEARLIQEKALGLMQQHIPKAGVPTIAVFNTLNWARAGLVEVYIDHELLPPNRAFTILDPEGRVVPAGLVSSRADGSTWNLWVQKVPPLGYTTLRIIVQEQGVVPVGRPEAASGNTLENDYYRLTVDAGQGGIVSLFDKQLGKELIDQTADVPLGAFLYERLANRADMERLTNNNRDTVYVPLKKEISRLSEVEIAKVETTPLWKRMVIHGEIPECADARGVTLEIRLYHSAKKIELAYSMVKLPVTEPEAVYVAFPFGMSEADQLAFDVQGGIVYPGINQLEGTASDWNTVQTFAAVQNKEAQVLWSSVDAPLVQVGAINTGRFYYKHEPELPHLYSWVLNNYWTTNFRASQEGEMKWQYCLTSVPDTSKAAATRFGWGNKVPMLGRVVPPAFNKTGSPPVMQSLLDLELPNLLLVSARPLPDRNAVLLHLRETDGLPAVLDLTRILSQTGMGGAFEANVLGETTKEAISTCRMAPYETQFILLVP